MTTDELRAKYLTKRERLEVEHALPVDGYDKATIIDRLLLDLAARDELIAAATRISVGNNYAVLDRQERDWLLIEPSQDIQTRHDGIHAAFAKLKELAK